LRPPVARTSGNRVSPPVRSWKPPIQVSAATKTGQTSSEDLAAQRIARFLSGEALGTHVSDDVRTRIDTNLPIVQVGTGSLGDVIVAHDQYTSSRVAVKVISMKQFQSSNSSREKIVRREVKAMRSLSHRNIVQLYDILSCDAALPGVSSEPPYLCIVMEYVADSEPLSYVIRRSSLSQPAVLSILRHLGSALAHMHERGFVHRDVWSENVLLTRAGMAMLIDLGCTEEVSEESLHDDLNIPYLSLQAAQGLAQRTADDCWSLGILVTEMITGKFAAERVGRTDIPFSYANNKLSEGIEEATAAGGPLIGQICAGLLEYDADKRMTMPQLLQLCSAAEGVTAAYASASLATQASPDPFKRSWVALPMTPSYPQPASSHQGSFTTPVATPFRAGQAVWYTPRTHGIGKQLAHIIGRSASNDGWQIRLVISEAIKEVTDQDVWRIEPAQSYQSLPQQSLQVAASGGQPPPAPRSCTPLVRARPMVETSLVSAVSGSLDLPAASSSSMSGTAPLSRNASAARLAFSTSESRHGNGSFVAGPPQAAPAATAAGSGLYVGARVLYTAKTDGQQHLARIVSQTASGWQLLFTTGRGKTVDFSDSHRLQVLPQAPSSASPGSWQSTLPPSPAALSSLSRGLPQQIHSAHAVC